MKAVKRKSFRRIVLNLSILFTLSLVASAQYQQPQVLSNDDLTQAKKLKLIVQSPGEVLKKFGSKQYYMPSLGQFCLWEEKFSKAANRPVKIRLGDQDYVDKLENKHN